MLLWGGSFDRVNEYSRRSLGMCLLWWLITCGEAAAAPSFTVKPAALNFPKQAVGTAGQIAVTVSNTGATSLTIDSFSLHPSQFQRKPAGLQSLCSRVGFSTTWCVSSLMPLKRSAVN